MALPDFDKFDEQVFIANGINRKERQKRQNLVTAYPHLVNFALFLTDEDKIDPSKLKVIAANANRFG